MLYIVNNNNVMRHNDVMTFDFITEYRSRRKEGLRTRAVVWRRSTDEVPDPRNSTRRPRGRKCQ